MIRDTSYSAFIGHDLLATGALPGVLEALKTRFEEDRGTPFLIFEDQTGQQVDFDLRGSLPDVQARYEPPAERVGPGRPRLGVVAREVSLLPRHWAWLGEQSSSASGTLRRLIDEAMRREPGEQQVRAAVNAVSRFLTAVAGNLPDYEEATRALYAHDRKRLDGLTRNWPQDIRAHIRRVLGHAF
jgi:uncharacterized protein